MSYTRDDRKGAHRANYERNRKRIFATQNTCGICGHLVDFSLKVPHPMSATADHIIPVAKNGHPTFLANRYKNVKHKKGRVIHNLRAIV